MNNNLSGKKQCNGLDKAQVLHHPFFHLWNELRYFKMTKQTPHTHTHTHTLQHACTLATFINCLALGGHKAYILCGVTTFSSHLATQKLFPPLIHIYPLRKILLWRVSFCRKVRVYNRAPGDLLEHIGRVDACGHKDLLRDV